MPPSIHDILAEPNPELDSSSVSWGQNTSSLDWISVTEWTPWEDFTYQNLASMYRQVLTARWRDPPSIDMASGFDRQVRDEKSLDYFLAKYIWPHSESERYQWTLPPSQVSTYAAQSACRYGFLVTDQALVVLRLTKERIGEGLAATRPSRTVELRTHQRIASNETDVSSLLESMSLDSFGKQSYADDDLAGSANVEFLPPEYAVIPMSAQGKGRLTVKFSIFCLCLMAGNGYRNIDYGYPPLDTWRHMDRHNYIHNTSALVAKKLPNNATLFEPEQQESESANQDDEFVSGVDTIDSRIHQAENEGPSRIPQDSRDDDLRHTEPTPQYITVDVKKRDGKLCFRDVKRQVRKTKKPEWTQVSGGSDAYMMDSKTDISVSDDDETRLHRTAVAQAFAFVLQAIRSPPPCQAWHDAAEHLDTWAVEYEDVLRSIPETDRKPRRETTYKAQRWKGFIRSPIRTRSRCLPPQDVAQQPTEDSDDDDDESPSPTPNPGVSRGGPLTTTGARSSELQEQDGSAASQEGTSIRPNIQDRLYCTHECLRGLAFGEPMDQNCPNLADHGDAHINRREFLQLARDQLAVDRGKDADCVPLYLSGSRGSLFKFCLSSHGYTLVAKGVEAMDAEDLLYENKIYSHLRDLQGKFVPVCLGVVDLIKPYYFNSGVYEDFMFLSYGGRPVLKGLRQVNPTVVKEILTALGRLHQHGVLHHDAEPRNVLYDKHTDRYMIVDLMLAELRTRQPLGSMDVNKRNRKRKWTPGKHEKDAFVAEAQSLRASLTQ
ncbi:hypothetical protein BHE90_016528 [Fusarium euwallaceae]|uniref:Protein kinase domain-containing protein n=1 Tax=Fusarium euwallaceae TaxID=1147111 RepID=A0A430L046_9HYPO|nr:hypothetical protein BHE90_016528 [Fusarium euwallaceae]